MPDLSVARRLPQAMSGGERTRPAWWPAWSVPAGLRTLRAVLVIPSLFALTFEGFGNLQMALFAAFGGFASLIMASFGGSRPGKLLAHLRPGGAGSPPPVTASPGNRNTPPPLPVTRPANFRDP